jgi:predicted RNA-binding Zn ribbon-like protein
MGLGGDDALPDAGGDCAAGGAGARAGVRAGGLSPERTVMPSAKISKSAIRPLRNHEAQRVQVTGNYKGPHLQFRTERSGS